MNVVNETVGETGCSDSDHPTWAMRTENILTVISIIPLFYIALVLGQANKLNTIMLGLKMVGACLWLYFGLSTGDKFTISIGLLLLSLTVVLLYYLHTHPLRHPHSTLFEIKGLN